MTIHDVVTAMHVGNSWLHCWDRGSVDGFGGRSGPAHICIAMRQLRFIVVGDLGGRRTVGDLCGFGVI